MLPTQLYLMTKLKMSKSVLQLPLYASLALTGTTLDLLPSCFYALKFGKHLMNSKYKMIWRGNLRFLIWGSVPQLMTVSLNLTQFPGILGSVPEFEAVSRNLKHCPWISGSFPEFEAVSRNVLRCPGIWNSVQESEALSKNLRQCTSIWGSAPEFDMVSRNLRERLGILGSFLQFVAVSTNSRQFSESFSKRLRKATKSQAV